MRPGLAAQLGERAEVRGVRERRANAEAVLRLLGRPGPELLNLVVVQHEGGGQTGGEGPHPDDRAGGQVSWGFCQQVNTD